MVWDLTDLPSPTTNNSWYAFGFKDATSNIYGFISLKNVMILTPQNVGFVYGDSCRGSIYENIWGEASAGATFSNVTGFAVDGYYNNISWANNLYAISVYSAYSITHSHFTAGTINVTLCQYAMNITANTNENGLGTVILKLNASNCGSLIYVSNGNSVLTSAKLHIVQINDFTTPYNAPLTISTDFVDPNNLLSADIDVYNHANQETSGATYNWLTPTYDGGQFILVHNIMGTTEKLYFTPTTPSVPVSGTAQENTNPYAVDVYIYGGTITQILITRNGTAYKVFYNSTPTAFSGQSYKLNPGDSITVSYSEGPDWEWLSD